jgi:hypothetical protein
MSPGVTQIRRGRAARSRIGQNPHVDRRILVVVGFVFAAMVGGGACGTNGQCDYGAGGAGGSGTFVGRLASVRGDRATFTVESFAANPGGAVLASPPRAGESVDVRYDSDLLATLVLLGWITRRNHRVHLVSSRTEPVEE